MSVSKQVVKDQIRKIGKFHKWFVGKELRALPKILNPGEEIGFLTSGYDGNHVASKNGKKSFLSDTVLIVATNIRLMVLNSGMVYGSDDRVFPYSKINSIRGERGIFFGKLRLSTAGVSGDDIVIKWMSKSDVARMVSVVSTYSAAAKNS